LYWRDIDKLRSELSMEDCSPELRAIVGTECREPYRELLRGVRDRLAHTREVIGAQLKGDMLDETGIYRDTNDLLQPLLLCYDSLIACNMQAIADDELTNIIRRVACFGLELLKLDIRQESTRHTEVLSAITEYLQLDNYGQKDETNVNLFISRT
jgi:phosphoenolpyruvate carboxylase